MSTRIASRRQARWGVAALLTMSLPMGAALSGCGGGKEASDTAHVTITEPTAAGASTAAAPAAGTGADPALVADTKTTAAPAADTKTAAPASSGGAEGWGTLKGKVVFSGDVPKAKVLVAKGSDVKDKELCSKQEIDSEKLVVDPASKGVKNVLVYIPKPTKVNPEATSAAKTAEIVFDQKNCVFIPHVLAGMKGATVTIKSSDSVGHNANSTGLNNNKFNLPTQPGSSQPFLLRGVDKPGKVGCDIHGWMEAYWLVLDNPYFAVTNDKGEFEIKNVPAGDQKVVVWAEALGPGGGYLTAGSGDAVSVKAGGDTTKDYTIDAGRVR